MSETEEPEVPQKKIPEELRTRTAMEIVINHGAKQMEIIEGMLSQANVGIDRAMEAPNDSTGSVLKMILPILIGRRKYLRTELEMWRVTIGMVQEDWATLQQEIERQGIDDRAKEEEAVSEEEDDDEGEGWSENAEDEGPAEDPVPNP